MDYPNFIQRLKYLFFANTKDLETEFFYLTKKRKPLKPSLRKKIFKVANNTCYYCKVSFSVEQLTVDHFIPFSQIKSHKESNLVCACIGCNSLKKDINPINPAHEKDYNDFYSKISLNNRLSSDEGVLSEIHRIELEFCSGELNVKGFFEAVLHVIDISNFKKNFSFRKATNKMIKTRYIRQYNILLVNSSSNIKEPRPSINLIRKIVLSMK